MQPFSAGQVWTYDARAGEETSRIVVCRVEDDPRLGQIVHIHVRGIRLKYKDAPGGFSDQIGHMPYAGEALRKSVSSLESTEAALPAFEKGYREWRAAFDEGEAGVWTTSVSDAIAGIETGLNR